MRDSKPVQYAVYAPTVAMLITLYHTHYFNIRLRNIEGHFTEKVHWAKDVDKLQLIFDDTPSAAIVRAGIEKQYDLVYSDEVVIEQGFLDSSPLAFFDVIKFNPDRELNIIDRALCRRRQGRPVHIGQGLEIFTYVLNDTLRFSRTSSQISVDIMSKHCLHARAASEVFYAGEFWIGDEDGVAVLYIDNGSGTFRPPSSGLHQMKQLLEENFPGISIVTLEHGSPQWNEIRGE